MYKLHSPSICKIHHFFVVALIFVVIVLLNIVFKMNYQNRTLPEL